MHSPSNDEQADSTRAGHGVIEQKTYAGGVGGSFEEHVQGGAGTFSLVEFNP